MLDLLDFFLMSTAGFVIVLFLGVLTLRGGIRKPAILFGVLFGWIVGNVAYIVAQVKESPAAMPVDRSVESDPGEPVSGIDTDQDDESPPGLVLPAVSPPLPVSPPPPPPVAKGILRITVPGGWAEVYIGGKKEGDTPLDLKLPEGLYEVELRLNGGPRIKTAQVEVRAGEMEIFSTRF